MTTQTETTLFEPNDCETLKALIHQKDSLSVIKEDSSLALIILRETNPAVLEELSYKEEWDIRYLVAKNPNTSPNTLERLSKDEYGDVRDSVAKNPNTPTHIKKFLNEIEQMRMLKEVTNPETLDSLTFLQWLEVAEDDQLEAFGQRENDSNITELRHSRKNVFWKILVRLKV